MNSYLKKRNTTAYEPLKNNSSVTRGLSATRISRREHVSLATHLPPSKMPYIRTTSSEHLCMLRETAPTLSVEPLSAVHQALTRGFPKKAQTAFKENICLLTADSKVPQCCNETASSPEVTSALDTLAGVARALGAIDDHHHLHRARSDGEGDRKRAVMETVSTRSTTRSHPHGSPKRSRANGHIAAMWNSLDNILGSAPVACAFFNSNFDSILQSDGQGPSEAEITTASR